jgi:elongation factor G
MSQTTRAPVIMIGVRAKTDFDRERLVRGLEHLITDDPTLSVHTDQRTGDVMIAGMGELHLDIVVARLRGEFGVDAQLTKPQAVYTEALTRSADGNGRHVKETGGRVECAEVKIHVYPGKPGSGYIFENMTPGESIPSQFVSEGIKDAAAHGVLAGYPMNDVHVQLYDGSSHGTVTSEAAFRIAGSMAFQDAARNAGPVVLEPVMRVTVTSPPEMHVAVMESLAGRGGALQSEEERDGMIIIQVRARLSKMFGYAAELRSQTLGRATYSVVLDRYEPIPGSR